MRRAFRFVEYMTMMRMRMMMMRRTCGFVEKMMTVTTMMMTMMMRRTCGFVEKRLRLFLHPPALRPGTHCATKSSPNDIFLRSLTFPKVVQQNHQQIISFNLRSVTFPKVIFIYFATSTLPSWSKSGPSVQMLTSFIQLIVYFFIQGLTGTLS